MSGLRMGHNTEYLYKVNLKKKTLREICGKRKPLEETHISIFLNI